MFARVFPHQRLSTQNISHYSFKQRSTNAEYTSINILGPRVPRASPATGVSTTGSALVLLRILDPGPPFPGFFAFLGPKILDTKIIHTSGKIDDFGGRRFSILGVEKCPKIYLTYVPI